MTLALLGTFTLGIIAGRGWVALAMVIFGRWQVGRAVVGALIFAAVYALGFRLQNEPGWDAVPYELLLAAPYVAVIVALALAGRNVAYPGAYLRPYRRA
jgi:simple sugar transport system permease protein